MSIHPIQLSKYQYAKTFPASAVPRGRAGGHGGALRSIPYQNAPARVIGERTLSQIVYFEKRPKCRNVEKAQVWQGLIGLVVYEIRPIRDFDFRSFGNNHLVNTNSSMKNLALTLAFFE
jgi:hypothetical protein